MRLRHQLLCTTAGFALAAAAAFGQGITIDGPQGYSTAALDGATESSQDTIAYWNYTSSRDSRATSSNPRNLSPRYGSSIRYAGGFYIRHGINTRGPFRYRIHEYSKRRFADLRPNTQGVRFDIARSNYAPGVKYTASFKGRKRFGSSIRYGFR